MDKIYFIVFMIVFTVSLTAFAGFIETVDQSMTVSHGLGTPGTSITDPGTLESPNVMTAASWAWNSLSMIIAPIQFAFGADMPAVFALVGLVIDACWVVIAVLVIRG
jgi:hypothetical protein